MTKKDRDAILFRLRNLPTHGNDGQLVSLQAALMCVEVTPIDSVTCPDCGTAGIPVGDACPRCGLGHG